MKTAIIVAKSTSDVVDIAERHLDAFKGYGIGSSDAYKLLATIPPKHWTLIADLHPGNFWNDPDNPPLAFATPTEIYLLEEGGNPLEAARRFLIEKKEEYCDYAFFVIRIHTDNES